MYILYELKISGEKIHRLPVKISNKQIKINEKIETENSESVFELVKCQFKNKLNERKLEKYVRVNGQIKRSKKGLVGKTNRVCLIHNVERVD